MQQQEERLERMSSGKSTPTYRSVHYATLPEEEGCSKPINSRSNSSSASYRIQYRVYPWRWLMLAALCALNISNGMMWLTFAPVPNYTASYYNISESDVDWFSMAYFVVSLVIGFVSIYILDTLGLKVALYAGASFNLVGALLRILSTIDPVICSPLYDKSGYMVALIGQILSACAQPFFLYSPTTLAAVWFGPKERAICTNLASVANPIGLAIVQLITPYIVTSTGDIERMLWIYAIPAAVSFIVTIIAFWYKEPPIPPAPIGDRDHVPSFWRGLLDTVKCWPFWVLILVWGVGAGIFNAVLTLLPQLLCPYGYSNKESGLWGSLMIFCGMVGATIAGLLIDYTKKFKEITVISLSMAILCYIWFMEVFTLQNQPILIAFSLCVFGFFALPLIPACLELGVEITYPVAEATSSGLLWSAVQIMGVVLISMSSILATPLSPELNSINQCGSSTVSHYRSNTSTVPYCFQQPYNDSNPSKPTDSDQFTDQKHVVWLYAILIAVVYVFFVFVFRPKYRRSDSERRASFEQSTYVGTVNEI